MRKYKLESFFHLQESSNQTSLDDLTEKVGDYESKIKQLEDQLNKVFIALLVLLNSHSKFFIHSQSGLPLVEVWKSFTPNFSL